MRAVLNTLGRATVALALIVGVAGLPTTSASETSKLITITVRHAPVTPTSVQGSGIGTVRFFSTLVSVGKQQGAEYFMVGTLTTLSVDDSTGKEVRASDLNFVLGAVKDQLVVGGVSYYAAAGSTLNVGATTVRPVIGGSGKYAGARGSVTSTNLGTDGWTHVFRIRLG